MAKRGNMQRSAARTRKMRARNSHLIRVFFFIIAMFLAFAVGFNMREQSAFLQLLGFPSTVTGIESTTTEQNAEKKDVYNSLSMRVSEAEDIIGEDSLDNYDLSTVTEAVLTAFADKSDDPFLRYYTPERYGALLNSKDEGYAGVGVLFSEYNGAAYAVDVFENSEAQKAGVREGDFVVSINGDRSQGWTRNEVAAVLSQAEGDRVVITWRRPESLESDGGDEYTTTLLCQETDQVNVSAEYDKERRVGYIKVRQFTQNASELVRIRVNRFIERSAGAIVLDLRDNPGGYLNQAVDVAGQFMSGGTVVQVNTVDGSITKNASTETLTDVPLVVLVNKNTAAAAEVVAAALKESQRAMLVGTNTMGKGSVQVLTEFSFGGALRYTAAYYLTPEGHDIDGNGVSPTVQIDSSGDEDSQLSYAMDYAASQVVE